VYQEPGHDKYVEADRRSRAAPRIKGATRQSAAWRDGEDAPPCAATQASRRTGDYSPVFFINKISHFHQISVVRQKLSDNIF
jgi:hypothetical protein